MKRVIAILFCIAVAFTMFSGCTTIQSDITKVENWINGTVIPDVCTLAKYYSSYLQGVATEAEGIPAVGPVIAPFVAEANTIVAGLNTACQNGTAAAMIDADLTKLDNLVQQINAAVGKVTVPAAGAK